MAGQVKPWVIGCVVLLLHSTQLLAQIAITAPAAQVDVPLASEWSGQAFQDPLDMSQRTDLGWFVNSIDQPAANLTGVSFSGGVFSATSSNSDPNTFILETGNPPSARLGKTGDTFSIDATTYRLFAVRMRLTGSGLGPPNTASAAQLLWNAQSIYDSATSTSASFFTFADWQIYLVDLPTLGVAAGSAWGGTIRTLRFDPLAISGIGIDIDWIRLVASSSAQTISWTGASSVDIYLDDDRDANNGTLGAIVKDGNVISKGVSGGSFTFQASALPPGDYFVAMRPAGTSDGLTYSSSSAFFRVPGIPTLAFTSPSPEGSSDDFATVQLNDAWDMAALSDLDARLNIDGAGIATISAETEAGTSLGNVTVLRGTSLSSGNTGDPYVYPLWFAGDGRGRYKTLDSARYRILTLEMGTAGARDINNGSIARIVWKNQGETLENVSQDIIINHRAGVNVLAKVTADMATLLREPNLPVPNGCQPCSTTGWTGQIDNFRVDPHEFTPATQFWIRRVTLAALEKANTSYQTAWIFTNPSATSATLSLYYDSDREGFNGTLIASGLDPINVSSTSGRYTWNTSGLPNGQHYVYAEIVSGGTVINRVYAPWPIGRDSSYTGELPRLVLDRKLLNFGGTNNGAIKTADQEVRVNIVGSGTTAWTVTPTDPSLVDVSPASGSGAGTFMVGIDDRTDLPSNLVGELGVVRVDATGAGNSPQFLRVVLRMAASGATTAPFGAFDTPLDSVTVQGSIAVTGWALDDLQVDRVEIWRDPLAGEATYYGPGHPGHGKVFIGRGTFIEDSRSDVEGLYGTNPFAYRSGWGHLILTRGNSWEGRGPFRLYAYAFDVDGRAGTLGTKTITIDNSTATKPFGAIDTPDQGATISGSSYVNFGWALTPQPKFVPHGSGVMVAIDGAFIGSPGCFSPRADITSGFPGFTNTPEAVRCFIFNTNTHSNGLHNIGWFVTDDAGAQDGVGSRFFRIFNTGSGAGLLPAADGTEPRLADAWTVFPDLGRPMASMTASVDPVTPLRLARGAATGEEATTEVSPDRTGVRVISIAELERIEVHLPTVAGPYAAYQVVRDELRRLPIGSSFDAATGIFYWWPGPGFLGRYEFVFVTATGTAAATSLRMRVAIRPGQTGQVTRRLTSFDPPRVKVTRAHRVEDRQSSPTLVSALPGANLRLGARASSRGMPSTVPTAPAAQACGRHAAGPTGVAACATVGNRTEPRHTLHGYRSGIERPPLLRLLFDPFVQVFRRGAASTGGRVAEAQQVEPVLADAQTVFPLAGAALGDVAHLPDLGRPVRVARGAATGLDAAVDVWPDGAGVRRIRIPELERIEVHLSDAQGGFSGYHDVGGELRGLPVGSSLDTRRGIFYWLPGPGFVGTYDLLFVRGVAGSAERVKVSVTIAPAQSDQFTPRMWIDTPAFDHNVTQPFVVAGWAIDLGAFWGTGVDTIHVWAYPNPSAGADPIFLGVAAYGGNRSDIGATFGEQFVPSGYGLTIDRLAPGTYDIVVHGHSIVTNTFNNARLVRVTVR
jgi:hypothetical protein